MLLENNGSGSMNGLVLVFTLIFFVGLISTYVVITYLIGNSKRKSLITTYSALLREHIQSHMINNRPVADDIILLVNQG